MQIKNKPLTGGVGQACSPLCTTYTQGVTNTFRTLELKRGPLQTLPSLQTAEAMVIQGEGWLDGGPYDRR